ncbi:outer membrane protein assembly factor BamD [Candidatus Finniella inopinata]|uniref:Outer membrane protein assembly factor BamD n=1 Tax=Candidatus Finniella inopinata TaxID=1696036 RepID=A0A4Q7DIY4_9PROT|nr:outer membrane protein assembly factor BamD [Candidatus Finniella inopinata]RZI45974.1 outer membrane protein assembly factor BamD [Candidatus Finniella inopinata]
MFCLKNITCFLLLLFALTGCGDKEELYTDRKVEDLYNIAMDHFEAKSYTKAARSFAEVERQHPYSNWALKAQLMSAYCYYEAKKYDESVEAFNLFIQLHPGHPEVAYAYYMLGLCHYEQIPIIERDQKPAEDSLKAFQEVINRFPASVYAKDAKFKIDLIHDHLAGKEISVGRYYQSQGAHLAAINRFKEVVARYQTTSHVPEALHRLVECYLSLGLKAEAQAVAAVLGHNFPNSDWYKDSYALVKQHTAPVVAPSPAK